MADQLKLTIEITTGHCLGGEGNDAYPGQVLVAPKDLSIADARKKVRMGYARIIPNAPEPGPEPEEDSGHALVAHADPAIEARDPITEPPRSPRKGRSRTGGR